MIGEDLILDFFNLFGPFALALLYPANTARFDVFTDGVR